MSQHPYIIKQDQERFTLGIVYEPDVVDSQGDFATRETIKAAQYAFMRRLQGEYVLTQAAVKLLDAIIKALDEQEIVRLDITDVIHLVENTKPPLGDQHEKWDAQFGDIVQCYLAPVDMEIGGEPVTEGTWLMGVIWSEEQFEKIKRGDRTGFSLGGRARSRETAPV